MIKVLLPLCAIFFIVLYIAFAFVNWDIAWVADTFQWLFLVLYVRLMAVFISERCVAGKE